MAKKEQVQVATETYSETSVSIDASLYVDDYEDRPYTQDYKDDSLEDDPYFESAPEEDVFQEDMVTDFGLDETGETSLDMEDEFVLEESREQEQLPSAKFEMDTPHTCQNCGEELQTDSSDEEEEDEPKIVVCPICRSENLVE